MGISLINIKTFNSIQEANEEKKKLVDFRSLHTDMVGHKIRVTFVNGNDDPENSDKAKVLRENSERKIVLQSKLEDDSITFNELKELMKIR